ncbi:TIR domain-containing protein [uncultured Erythrobacter sp.]|uniref:TIR domain-containing protein n=1 Tax=uncultured Erythrobacter sp. TaxID=263913 RepID=UPI002629B63D|nr:TIR domain-containing protein [uncultured Erythrobacter sp.]
MDIFISYSRSDRERVNHIAKGLEAEGYSVWWDRDIRAGEEFDHVIDKAIKKSKAIIVVWSKHSIDSRWVKEEAEDGVEADTLVPITIDPVTIPRGFRRIQAAELQDGGDNPTNSINWPEFLDSVRKQAGEGEGTPSPDDPLAQALSRAATATAAPSPTPAPAAESKSAPPVWKRYWPAAASIFGLLVAGVLALQLFGGGSITAPDDPEDMTPVVLGIYPNESFGLDQARGLDAAFNDMPQVMVVELSASLDAMKAREAPELIERLKTYLAERNVVAIVGPSITEFTPQVLEVVENSGRNPAIVLTTAASRQDIGWDDSNLPLFRVGSGVDERAEQFARLAQNTVASGVELVLAYEKNTDPNETTYGQLFFRRITERLPQWREWSDQNRVRSISYTRGSIMDSFSSPQRSGLFDQNKMVVVVGLSSDYKDLVENFYGAGQPRRAALLGGWNTSKAVRDISAELPVQHTRLFDMTDVYRSPADTRALPDSRRFQQEFGVLTPALRQEAVAYDSGLVVKQAITQIEGEVRAEELVAILRGQRFNGVTGEITFPGDGENWGQNSGTAGGMRPLYNLSYDPGATNWTEIESFDALLGREIARN